MCARFKAPTTARSLLGALPEWRRDMGGTPGGLGGGARAPALGRGGGRRPVGGAASQLLLLLLLSVWGVCPAEGWVRLGAENYAGSFPDVAQHTVGDFAVHTEANHITFQDDWQMYSGGDLFEIRSHAANVANADGVNASSLQTRLTLDKSGNIIVRDAGNNVTAGVQGAAILGGGTDAGPNLCQDSYTVISGGLNNQAGNGGTDVLDAAYASVGGGQANVAGGLGATVGGGVSNQASGAHACAAGGLGNAAA
jgi:hypothetical protein